MRISEADLRRNIRGKGFLGGFSFVTSAGKQTCRNQSKEEEIRADIKGRMNKGNSPENCPLSKLHQSVQTRPNHRPLGEQYETPSIQINKRQGGHSFS